MSRLIAALLLATVAASGLPGAVQTKPASSKKAASGQKKTSAKKPSTGSSRSTSKAKPSTKQSSKKSTPRKSYRAVQQVPTPDRYREIQQALAAKGYFTGEADGVWGPDSVDALKHFQRDQGLSDDGKLDSLTIIGLGLGPQRSTNAQVRRNQ